MGDPGIFRIRSSSILHERSWRTSTGSLGVHRALTIAVVRFGVLAAASMALFSLNIRWFPLTLDLNAFYVAASFVSMSALVGLVCFGLYTSLGGKPLAGWTENP